MSIGVRRVGIARRPSVFPNLYSILNKTISDTGFMKFDTDCFTLYVINSLRKISAWFIHKSCYYIITQSKHAICWSLTWHKLLPDVKNSGINISTNVDIGHQTPNIVKNVTWTRLNSAGVQLLRNIDDETREDWSNLDTMPSYESQ